MLRQGFSKTFVGVTSDRRIVATSDIDCLPAGIIQYQEFVTTANFDNKGDRSERFWHHYDKMRWLEQLGFTIKIDFGSHFYETGGEVEIS